MERVELRKLTNDQLVERFVAIGEAQDDAKLYDDIPEYNRLYGVVRNEERGVWRHVAAKLSSW